MITVLLALALQVAAPTSAQSDEAMYRSCTALAKRDPSKAVEQANEWFVRGGGIFAKACLGLAYAGLQRWQPAAVSFEQAARDAESAKDGRAADLWAQSGNAWLAGDDPLKARGAFDAALIVSKMTPALRGEIHLDRARADVALNDLAAAQSDLDKGLELVPGDAFGWYLSAALAMRQEAVTRAQTDIAKALQLAPDDADVLLLAGNISGMTGNIPAARGYYERAIKASPNSEAAKQAQRQLVTNSVDVPLGPEPPPLPELARPAKPQLAPEPRPEPQR